MAEELMTGAEIVANGPVKFDYPTDYICLHKENIIESIFRKYLSLDLLEKLIADKTDLHGHYIYDSTSSYSLGDLVFLDGIVYISLVGSNIHSIRNTEYWEIVSKFQTDCYNTLWDKYLKKFLSSRVIYSTIEYTTFPASSKGVIQYVEDGTGISGAGYKGLSGFKKAIWDDSIDIYENMKYWISQNPECFEDLELWNSFCVSVRSPKRQRRIAFKY